MKKNKKDELEPEYLTRLIRGHAAKSLASSENIFSKRLNLYDFAEKNRVPVGNKKYLECLVPYAAEFGWDNDYSPESLEGYNLLKSAAQRDCQNSNYILEKVHEKGLFEGLHRDQAIEYYNKSLFLGNSLAANDLGNIYEKGRLVKRDDDKAFEFHSKYSVPLLLNRPHNSDAVENDLLTRKQYLTVADLILEAKGFDFELTDDIWSMHNVYLKKAIGKIDPYTSNLILEKLPPFNELDEIAVEALAKLAKSLYFGMGLRRNTARALLIWWRLRKISSFARKWLVIDLFKIRRRPPEILKGVKYQIANLSYDVLEDDIWLLTCLPEFDSWEKRIEILRRNADKHRSYKFKLSIVRLLIGGKSQQEMDFSIAELETLEVPFPVRHIIEDSERLEKLNVLIESVINNFAGSDSDLTFLECLFSNNTKNTVYLCDLISSSNERAVDDFYTLRVYLARSFSEPIEHLWRQREIEHQLENPNFYNKLLKSNEMDKLSKELLLSSTVDIGPDPSERDENGFPLFTRAIDRRGFWEKKTDQGWDRINSISISNKDFVVGKVTRTEKKKLPLIFKSDIELILILTLVNPEESNKKVLPPRFGLEDPFKEPINISNLTFKKKFYSPRWLGITNFGRSLYYMDTLLFINENAKRVFSTTNPTVNASSALWKTPNIWLKANQCGGVSASSVGRNAFVCNRRDPLVDINLFTFDDLSSKLNINIPIELSRFDGSEHYLNEKGAEIHRDGGRYLLRYYTVRHADVLTNGISEVYRAFPIFQRVAHLYGLYSTLNEVFTPEVRAYFVDTPLYSKLKKRRKQYIEEFNKVQEISQFVIRH